VKVYDEGAPKAAETTLTATVSVAVPLPVLPRTAEGAAGRAGGAGYEVGAIFDTFLSVKLAV
jgi:hypothetical protein